MANYTFETITPAQAAGFTTADFLIFSNSGTTASSLRVTPADASGLNNSSITLSDGSHEATFPSATLSTASLANHLVFNDQSVLALGTSAGDTSASFQGTTGDDVVYGFAGNDSLGGGNGNDYIYGGTDTGTNAAPASGGTAAVAVVFGDTLNGGDGNDHIYGNSVAAQRGDADGPDLISGGNGSDYLQGNAGTDSLSGGNGSDQIFGGGDADTIVGGDGNDTVNGNLGNDSITGDAGNDYLRGGQGDDVILGGTGDDIIKGDLGADSITGGAGLDVVEGGQGNDTFIFGSTSVTTGGVTTVTSDAAYSTTGASAYVTDVISDYADGADKIALGFTVAAVLHASAGASFTTVAAAQTYAQGLLSSANTVGDVAAVNVGNDTYLFYNNAGAAAGASTSHTDAAIRILNTDSAVLSTTAGGVSDFV